MKVDTEIDDANLDDAHPDEDDGGPMLFVHVSVRVPDGMGFNGSVAVPADDVTPSVVAEALVSAMHGSAMTYSPATWTALNKWLREPKGLRIVKGGEDA